MIVVADTSPINYLLLINEIELLPKLFREIVVPSAVWNELKARGSPKLVRDWTNARIAWVMVQKPHTIDNSIVLGTGEREAISLAQEIKADLVLVDDRKARLVAIGRGLKVAGTINVLESASKRNMVDLEIAFSDLRQTNFRIAPKLVEEILKRNR